MKNVIKWLKLDNRVHIPSKAHATDAGMDMRVLVDEDKFRPESKTSGVPVTLTTLHDIDLGTTALGCTILPNQTIVFHTGLKCETPEGFYLEVNPRSSLGFKKDIMLANTTGIVDCHYRGELMVALHNNGIHPQVIEDGERVVQCMLKKVEEVESIEVTKLSETDRGEGGFGSSGRK